jgi:alkaline phosphatase
MVEGASIDKQSHSGHSAGATWDVIEFDKAVGAGRAWAAKRKSSDTLLIVTADHGQSMNIVGLADISDADLHDRKPTHAITVTTPSGKMTQNIYKDANANIRAQMPYASFGRTTGPPAEKTQNVYTRMGFPDYVDADGDGYPENREVNGRGHIRLALGFRTGEHTGSTLPITSEGPGAFLFTGYMDQTDVMLKVAAVLGGDTRDIDLLLQKMIRQPGLPRTFGK